MADPANGRKRQPFRRLSTDQRREELIDAAIGLFGRQPEDEVSVDEIAAAAGTSRSSLYRHFDDKGALYLASMRKLSVELIRRLTAVTGGSPSQQLARRIRAYFDFLEEYGVGYAELLQMSSQVPSQEALGLAEEVRGEVYRLTYRTLRLDDPPPALQTALQAWVAGLEWVGRDWLRDRSAPRADIEMQMQVQFAAMLIAVAAYDPVMGDRLLWVTEVEPPDGPAAAFVAMLLGMVSPRLVGNVARMLGGGAPAPAEGGAREAGAEWKEPEKAPAALSPVPGASDG